MSCTNIPTYLPKYIAVYERVCYTSRSIMMIWLGSDVDGCWLADHHSLLAESGYCCGYIGLSQPPLRKSIFCCNGFLQPAQGHRSTLWKSIQRCLCLSKRGDHFRTYLQAPSAPSGPHVLGPMCFAHSFGLCRQPSAPSSGSRNFKLQQWPSPSPFGL